MDEERKLIQEISSLTTKLETNYPELYRFLDESVVPGGLADKSGLDIISLRNYLNDLRSLLQHYLATNRRIQHESV